MKNIKSTTAHLLLMLFYYVSKFPEVKKKLVQEVEASIKSEADLVPDILNKMDYLNAVILET